MADFQRRYNGLRIKALKINLRKLYKQTLSIKFLKISLTLERLSHFRRRKKDCLQLRLKLYVSNFLSTHSDVLARDKLTLKLLETKKECHCCRHRVLFCKIKVRPRSCRSYPLWRPCRAELFKLLMI